MKLATILLILSLQTIAYGQVSDSTDKSGNYYIISEAYLVLRDTTLNLNNYFVDKTSGILFLSRRDSSIIISIDHGGLDSVIYLGHAKKIQNPGFNVRRNDSEFYKWSYMEHNKPEHKDANVMKEYVTGSLEEKGRKYYFINIVNTDQSQFQFYAYLYIPVKNN
jgi:hypothetical protein